MIGSQREVRVGGRRFYVDMPGAEAIERFACFGGSCTVIVSGGGPAGTARAAALWAKRRLVAWHEQFSRFDSRSELSRLNQDPQGTVRVSSMMARFVQSALRAATITGGLVDPTLVGEIEHAGYRSDFDSTPVPLAQALELAPPRAASAPSQAARWREVSVDLDRGTVTRPPGVRLDSGGIAKGLFGDVLVNELSGHEAFAVEAAGDVRIGGRGRPRRAVEVADPFADSVLHAFELAQGAAATSGIDKRSWIGEDGRPAHHLLDPATGMPAFTGIVQATALAPTALEAELRSKAALLSGPEGARVWLVHGGLIVYDDGTFELLEVPAGARDLDELDARELTR
jgi:thiamine biosynthesis lipoprotein